MEQKPTEVNPLDPRMIAFQRVLNIMDELREKCPWDKKQTMESLRHLTIEETFELADSIENKDINGIKGELGDLFLHIVFYAKIASENEEFDITDVIHAICDKLVHRHPHIYGDIKVNSEEEVKSNWEKLKLKEGKKSVLEGVPNGLPALIKAMRIQEKVKGVGFDWEIQDDVLNKIIEEINELKEAVNSKNQTEIVNEFGDVLFSIINWSRFLDVNADEALSKTNKKFIQRFQKMEELLVNDQLILGELSLETLDSYWDKAKKMILKSNFDH